MFGAIEVKALFIPTEYALSQNYPNPFNPSTTFTYDVPEVSEVTITVYSLLGKEVRTLYSEQQMPGRYTETWDGTDNTGRKLASGVYFLRMQAGSYSKLRKMTLIR
jgi:flagellar hook assembly protein FlgD